ncbi:hypothetical protein XA68_16812 [Ophiocordyceps unilateralis]|uniref:Uncharacterized protein n=1 Tax=Ophiocordyceps unilateralis TaxID=268505 RepID=A0A2A9PL60_OPHUN|nr:hypothetical protein XA68_16812 [Ophiocordyceps unilateralis]
MQLSKVLVISFFYLGASALPLDCKLGSLHQRACNGVFRFWSSQIDWFAHHPHRTASNQLQDQRFLNIDNIRRVPPAEAVDVIHMDIQRRELAIHEPKRKMRLAEAMKGHGIALSPERLQGGHGHIKRDREEREDEEPTMTR